jgi:outer membrane lipoprotein SlyB
VPDGVEIVAGTTVAPMGRVPTLFALKGNGKDTMRTTAATTQLPLAAAVFFTLAGCAPQDTDESPATDEAALSEDNGQSQTSAAEERAAAPDRPAIPTGTELTFVIDETLSTDDTDAGHMFDAHLADAVTSADGSVALPAGTAARGIVIASRESEGSDDPAALIVRLETVEFDGDMVPLDATVVRADTDTSTRDTGAETAGKIAIGAAAGAIIGQIIGRDTESTLAGAGAGAVAGTVVALTTRDGDATLPAGSTIVVRLDQPLRAN